MPTYRNDTAAKITHQGKSYMEWMPGEEKRLAFFVPYKDLGLTLADPEPYVRRRTGVYDYREFEIAPGEVVVYDIPYHETFELSLSALSGAAVFTVGDGDVETVLDTLHDHVSTYAWDQAAWLTFRHFGADAPETAEPAGPTLLLIEDPGGGEEEEPPGEQEEPEEPGEPEIPASGEPARIIVKVEAKSWRDAKKRGRV